MIENFQNALAKNIIYSVVVALVMIAIVLVLGLVMGTRKIPKQGNLLLSMFLPVGLALGVYGILILFLPEWFPEMSENVALAITLIVPVTLGTFFAIFLRFWYTPPTWTTEQELDHLEEMNTDLSFDEKRRERRLKQQKRRNPQKR